MKRFLEIILSVGGAVLLLYLFISINGGKLIGQGSGSLLVLTIAATGLFILASIYWKKFWKNRK